MGAQSGGFAPDLAVEAENHAEQAGEGKPQRHFPDRRDCVEIHGFSRSSTPRHSPDLTKPFRKLVFMTIR